MGSEVYHKLLAVTEDLPTLIAFIRFFTSVNSQMYNEVRVLIEGFPTLIALIGFFTSVKSLMMNNTFTQVECLITLFTFKRFFFSMVRKLRVLIEGFPTLTAFECFFPRVEALMSSKTLTSTENFATFVAFISLLSSVDFLMVN